MMFSDFAPLRDKYIAAMSYLLFNKNWLTQLSHQLMKVQISYKVDSAYGNCGQGLCYGLRCSMGFVS
jgi:hypothetical protein